MRRSWCTRFPTWGLRGARGRERAGPTRSHPEPGRDPAQRRRVLWGRPHGRRGRRGHPPPSESMTRGDGSDRVKYTMSATRGGAAAARWAHNPKVGGSNPPPATRHAGTERYRRFFVHPSQRRRPVRTCGYERSLTVDQVRAISAFAVDLVYPRRCAGCGRRGRWLCHECETQTERFTPPWCPTCGVPTRLPCQCASEAQDLAQVRSVGPFAGWLRGAVIQTKSLRQ